VRQLNRRITDLVLIILTATILINWVGGRVITSAAASELDGTYYFKRASLYTDGKLLDSEQPSLSASGTLTISGNNLVQIITVTINNTPVKTEAKGTFVDNGYYIRVTQDNANSYDVATISRGDLLVLFGGEEVDQWNKAVIPTLAQQGDDITRQANPSALQLPDGSIGIGKTIQYLREIGVINSQ
jgi:hypothetical protein